MKTPLAARPRSNRPRIVVRAVVVRALLFSVLWLVLTGDVARGWAAGGPAVLLATTASLWLLPPSGHSLSLTGSLAFLVFFLGQSVRSGVQVAAMALRPRAALCPGLIDIGLRLADDRSRVLLASTLNLMPGTLSIDLAGRRLRLHVMDRRQPIEEQVRRAERHVARLLGRSLQ